MKRLLAALALAFVPASGHAAFDSSEYRQNTYGAPDYYCDLTLSIAAPSGSGTLGDPWNATRCMSQPVAGDVVGILPGVSVQLTAQNNRQSASFRPANSGTLSGSTCTARIVYVTKYAAVALDYATIGSNANRTQIRDNGTDDAADVTGTGSAAIGVNGESCITFDGFYLDMASLGFRNDTGVLNAWSATGTTFTNFVVKGKTTDCDSNCSIIRTDNVENTSFLNYYVQDFFNVPTGGGLNQAGETSIEYGARNSIHRHFHLKNTDRGLFLKGTSPAGVNFNYGTYQYGIIESVGSCFAANDLHATEVTIVQYVLCTPSRLVTAVSNTGIEFNCTTTACRNITIDHVTVAKTDATSINTEGGMVVGGLGLGAGVTITNNAIDNDNGTYGHEVWLLTTLPATMNYNCYTKNGGTETYVYNGTEYNTFANWQGAISGRDANSQEVASVGFTDRTNNDFNITSGACLTASSTGGEVGAYATSEVIGPDTNAASSSGPVTVGGGVRFTGSVRIQ